MKASVVAVVAISVAAIVFVTVFIADQPGGADSTTTASTSASTSTSSSFTTVGTSTTTTTVTTSSGSQSTTTTQGQVSAGGTDPNGLQVELSLRLYPGVNGSTMVGMVADEYNTLPRANNVSTSSSWSLGNLSLGPCGREVSPYGVAVYRGAYTLANVSQAQPLQIYPVVACPMLIRLVTGYLFQPSSDMALVLPGSGNATAMMSKVNATGTYPGGPGMASSPVPLSPGVYTAAAGDEWGSVVVIQFTIAADGSASLAG